MRDAKASSLRSVAASTAQSRPGAANEFGGACQKEVRSEPRSVLKVVECVRNARTFVATAAGRYVSGMEACNERGTERVAAISSMTSARPV